MLVLWWFGGGSGRVAPTGRLAEEFQAEILASFAAVGKVADPSSCSMSGNVSWGVSCKTSGASIDEIQRHFLAKGWKPASAAARGEVALIREKDYLTIYAFSDGQVAVGIRRLKS
jgi:hypothetical protein